MATTELMNMTPKFEGELSVSFVAGGDEAKAVLDLKSIPWHESSEGFSVRFPESLQVFSDADAESQASFYVYQVGAEKFVYPLDTEVLVVE
jgi:hypothetical protein